MANALINGTLIFSGAFAGQASIQAQPIGGNLIFQLPNQLPTVNQLFAVESVSGSIVTMGFANASGAPSFSSITGSLALSQISTAGATSGDVIQYNGTNWAVSAFVPGSGTVTSVALTAPAEFAVGGSPITGAGTLAITKATQSANTVWAGPTTGSAAQPTFRALVAADVPTSLPALTVAESQVTGLTADLAAKAPSASPTFTGLTTISGTSTFSTANPTFFSAQGNGGKVQLSTGTTTLGDVVSYDTNGNAVDNSILNLNAHAVLVSPAVVSITGTTGVGIINTTSGDIAITQNGSGNITSTVGSTSLSLHSNSANLTASTASVAIANTGSITVSPAGGTIINLNGVAKFSSALQDGTGVTGTTGQVLSSTGGGTPTTLWVTPTTGVQVIHITGPTTTIDYDLGSVVQLYTDQPTTDLTVINADPNDVLYLTITAGIAAYQITFNPGSFNGIGDIYVVFGETASYTFFNQGGQFSQSAVTFPINNSETLSLTTPSGGSAQTVLQVKSTETSGGTSTSQWSIDGAGNMTTTGTISAATGSDLELHATGTNQVGIQTGTGTFSFFGNGGGMTLASQNANVSIDVNGNITLGTSNASTKISLAPNGVVNISGVPGPYANNAAATGAGLVAGDVYYTTADPRALAVTF